MTESQHLSMKVRKTTTSVGFWTTLVHQADLFPQLTRSVQDSQKGYTQSLKGMLGMQTSAFAGKLIQPQNS